MTDSAKRRVGWITYGIPGLFFAVFFSIINWIIDPRLIYSALEPPFFRDSAFFIHYLQVPGGLSTYIGSLLTQVMFYGWPGALLLTGLIAAICLLTAGIIQSRNNPFPMSACIPGSLLLALLSIYPFPVSPAVALALTLGSALIFLRLGRRPVLLRAVVFIVLAKLLYLTAGAFLFLFVLLVILHELFEATHKWMIILTVLTALLLPFLSYRFFFIISAKQAFTNQLPFVFLNRTDWLGWILLLYFPVLFILNKLWFGKSVFRSVYARVAGLMIPLCTLAIFLPVFSKPQHDYWETIRLSRIRDWNRLLEHSKQIKYRDPIISILTNRALYHTQHLGDEMFTYPQLFGIHSLVVQDQLKVQSPIEKSELALDLGYVNESLHWASEALSINGETPFNLKQMATLYVIKGEYRTAALFLQRLSQTFIYRDWAVKMAQDLRTPVLVNKNPAIRSVRANLFREDFIVESANPCRDFEQLMVRNPANRMAYEYYLAYTLLDKDLPAFVDKIADARKYFSALLPKHYEEAVLIHMYIIKGKELDLSGFQIRKDTIDRFKLLRSLVEKARGDLQVAKPGIYQNLKDSYWYYYLYQESGYQE